MWAPLVALALAAAPVPPVVHDTVEGGVHWRITTDLGPVHVWYPSGYDRKTAGIVFYLHGYYVDVDEAWTGHRLAEQFRLSRRNAVFVVPEVPTTANEKVRWNDPEALLAAVQNRAKVEMPPGPVAVMGHSGAFRTVLPWLAFARLEQVILLDGLYKNEADFLAWLNAGAPERPHRLVLVGFETAEKSAGLLAAVTDAYVRDGIPELPSEFKRSEKRARLLYVHSQYDHMALVTEGRAIPVLLRLAPLRPL